MELRIQQKRGYDCHPDVDFIQREEQRSRQRDKTYRDWEVFGEMHETNGSLPEPAEMRRNCHARPARLTGAPSGRIADSLTTLLTHSLIALKPLEGSTTRQRYFRPPIRKVTAAGTTVALGKDAVKWKKPSPLLSTLAHAIYFPPLDELPQIPCVRCSP